MSGCKVACLSARKKCECVKQQCRCEQKLIKDCLCVEWSVQQGEGQTVFQTGGLRQLFASGFITFDGGCSDYVVVRFYLEGSQVGSSINLFGRSSVAFAFTSFDQIRVECPVTVDCPDPCVGEICLNARYPVG